MTVRLSSARLSLFHALLLASCIADLRPEVGPRIKDDGETTQPSSNDDGASDSPGDGTPGDADDGTGDAPGDGDGASDDSDAGTPSSDDGEEDADGEPDQDAGVVDNGCPIKDSNPAKSVSFAADVMPILAVCRCHNPNSDDPFAIMESGLTIDGYENLRLGGEHTGPDVIVNGNPCTSIILQKLSETPPFGDRMPFMGPYLSSEVRGVISDWIAEGARDN
jgi:hypothetical protein